MWLPALVAAAVAAAAAASDRPIVAVCTCARSMPAWQKRDDGSFFSIMVPSLLKTVSDAERAAWDVRLYVGIDDDDLFFQKTLPNGTAFGWLPVTLTTVPRRRGRVPFNENAATAHAAGAEYFVRVNDDTEFVTPGWLSIGVAALRAMTPPNVGVVGPKCEEGNTEILTHDMTHRTHMEIFNGLYYTSEFSAWWIDDWITKVYEPGRMRVLQNWVVKHHLHLHGTRYAVSQSESKFLVSAIERGVRTVKEWCSGRIETALPSVRVPATVPPAGTQMGPAQISVADPKLGWTILVTVNNGYYDFFRNWWAHYSRLKMPNRVVVVSEDDAVHAALSKDYPTLTVERSSLTGQEAHLYDSKGYKAMVSARAQYIQRHLQAGEDVLYADVDTVWLSDPTSHIGPEDLVAEIDNPSFNGVSPYYCTGFMAIRNNARSRRLINLWDRALSKEPQLNQPVFNRLLHAMKDLRHSGFSRTLFPSGMQYFDKTNPEGGPWAPPQEIGTTTKLNVVVVHNNFIQGHEEKKQRFIRAKLWII